VKAALPEPAYPGRGGGNRTTGRKLGLKLPPSAIPHLGVSHHITQTPLRFLRGTTCGIASQPTCRGSALDRSVLRDLEATQQERYWLRTT
jgi:hypothetical protein